ncbi:phage portal protein [Tellurirhabdus bombi]|uniref:phage portal protein n=1 Tax=Tellurirhabdus bombi TaxID=2907205 RepID=UPI001F3E038B|nr:phage portal protein [Tellurirhabdus bombi]
MNIWQRATSFWSNRSESRSTSGSYSLTDSRLLEQLHLNSGSVHVSVETSLSLATVYRCVDLLSSSVASLPWELFQVGANGRSKAVNHPVYRLLKTRPHRLYTSFQFRKTLVSHALLWGNGYALIKRNGINRPVSLEIFHPREVTVLESKRIDGEKYVFYRFNGIDRDVPADDVLHLKLFALDGIIGKSVIRQAAEGSFKTALQSTRFINSLLENGGRPAGIIKVVKALTDPALKRLKGNWFSDHGGTEKAGKVAILDEGMDYQAISVNPVDAQLLEMMKLSREDICALFGVPQHLANILDKATFSNIEHQDLEYIKYFLMPHLINLEQETDYKLLREEEQGSYYSKFNLNALLRGDLNSRKEFYRAMVNAGIMTRNEVRELEDLNPVQDGDRLLVQSGMVYADRLDDFIDSKQSKKLGDPPPAVAA